MDKRSSRESSEILDILGIGIGPFNLGLAAMLKKTPEVQALFLDKKPRFEWHPGLLIEGTTLQVPFFADVVTMADPTSPFSFLNYLKEHQRLYHFYFLERFHIPRNEYNHYCQWVTQELDTCLFNREVINIQWEEQGADSHYRVTAIDTETDQLLIYQTRHLVLGTGSVPNIDPRYSDLPREDVFHSARFLENLDRCRHARSITVVGSGQSAAEVFYTLLQEQSSHGYQLDWFTRSNGFFPMEYSKLGLEHFSPEYTRHFHSLSPAARDEKIRNQDLLYKGISASTIADIYDLLYERTVGGKETPARLLSHVDVRGISPIQQNGLSHYRLNAFHRDEQKEFTHDSEVVILSTGYHHAIPPFIAGIRHLIEWDEQERYVIDEDYRLSLTHAHDNAIFIQNGELHTHGVGAPDLGLGAYRNSVIINTLTGRNVYSVSERNVFQQFGVMQRQSLHKSLVKG
ncbi:lysine N(6)-hydroxylase/L-ornithine N(5)-oxygenase family protein [Marininema halotolerans]|uniref:L-lysine N6-monooxygenase MbtG n=1 Tax=Marininema halotolerans TaxID=1155944 RepID=A0A1I6R0W1_9BACL|nr:lysine N(6)-hydroxylase/L-ornithine N(5)-oxygenase family protein [Marininema halotolerans]SFS58250.1 lysine N6-hydroxylase [Marininema halotolerans]